MLAKLRHSPTGAATIIVLLMTMIFVAVGAFVLLALNRNIELRSLFQRRVSAFYAAEAGLNYGAVGLKRTLVEGGVPTNCGPQTIDVNGHAVTYRLSGCGQPPVTRTIQDPPYEGMSGTVYTYALESSAVNRAGTSKAVLGMQFQVHLIPIFQFGVLYKGDLESLSEAPSIIHGRIYSGGDLYVNSGDCADGQQILGQAAAVGRLIRGRKDSNSNANRVSITNADGYPQLLGTNEAGSPSCAAAARRTIDAREAAAWGGRILTGVGGVTLPDERALLCTPWSCPRGAEHGVYWDRASLRVVLDTTTTAQLLPGTGAALYPVQVVDAAGVVDPVKTAALQTFMRTTPGAITYSDVPVRNQDCRAAPTCEATYASPMGYRPVFPEGPPTSPCLSRRSPRDKITPINYCYDYRSGGFYNWRESKPILMLNIDWMVIEEWNLKTRALFDPAAADAGPDGGVVVFLSVKGDAAQGANNYGVRIYDASRVRRNTGDSGITFASDVGAYVVGNFNCPASGAGSGETPLCGGNGAVKPASVVADTINVLSCAWMDNPDRACGPVKMDSDQWAGVGAYRLADERSTQPAPAGFPAQATTVSAAVLAGTDDTWCPSSPGGLDCGKAYYGGGLENFFRFHENWSGQKLWHRGAVARVGTPRHSCFAFVSTGIANDPTFSCSAHAPWQGFWSQQRSASPLSRLFYDTGFNDLRHLPPLTAQARFVTQHWLVEATAPIPSEPAASAGTPSSSAPAPVVGSVPPAPPSPTGPATTPPPSSRRPSGPSPDRPASPQVQPLPEAPPARPSPTSPTTPPGPMPSNSAASSSSAPSGPQTSSPPGPSTPSTPAPSAPARSPALGAATSSPPQGSPSRDTAPPAKAAAPAVRPAPPTRAGVTPPVPPHAASRSVPQRTSPSHEASSEAPSKAQAKTSTGGTASPQQTSKPSPRYHVQLGAFVQRAYAEDLLRQARARGYDAALVGGPMYRVWVGGPLDRSAAERLEASLKADGFETVLKPCSSC